LTKVGVIGVGHMGGNHARILSELPNVELKAICDFDEDRAKQVGQMYHAKPYKDYSKMLQEEDLDAVSIAAPTRLHADVINNAVDCVKNVLVEKPIASTFEEAKNAVGLADKKNVNLMVGYVERFNPVVDKLKEIVAKEGLKRPIVACARRLGPYAPWIRDQGVVLGLAIHDIDILGYALDCEVKEVFASNLPVYSEFEDFAALVLELEGGGLCTMEASQFSLYKTRTFDVYASDKNLSLDLLNQTIHTIKLDKKNIREEVPVKKGESLRIELQHFINVALGKEKPLATAKEGLRSFAVALAALESAKKKRPVRP